MAELRGTRALITGASSGIGAALARALAARGVDLVLTARRKAALDEVAAAGAAHGVRVDVIVAVLGREGAAAPLWAAASAGGAIQICINNAGFGYFRPFGEIEEARDAELLQLNVTSLVELSKLFVRARLGAPASEGRSYLMNIASIAAFQPVPNMAVYAASKAFVLSFSEALAAELAGTPISVTCVCPGGTHTEFHANAGAGNYGWLANASMLSAEACAAQALRAMERGKRSVVTGVLNKLSSVGVRLIPRAVASWMARRVLGQPRAGALPPRRPGAA